MNELNENIYDDLVPDESLAEPPEPPESAEPPEPPECVRSKPRKGLFSRIRNFIFGVLVAVYLLTVIISGYWYWSRPVRKDQIDNAYEWWTAIAEVYHIPVPKDERWGN